MGLAAKLRLPSSMADLRRDFERLAFAAAFLLSVCGTITTCGGLAALTNYCLSNQPLGLGAGFKLTPPWTAYSTEVMRMQKAVVTGAQGQFQCGKFFRFDWFLWAFQVVFLCIVGAAWYRATLRKYGPGLWAMGATITAWHLYKINYICDMDQWTTGTVHTSGLMAAGGLMVTSAGNYLMFLAGCAYGLKQRPAGQVADDTHKDTVKGSFGSRDDAPGMP